MADPNELDLRYGPEMREEANRSLERGAAIALALGLVSAAALPIAMALDLAVGLEVPAGFTLFCCVVCAVLYVLARRRLVWGVAAWPILLGFASLPTLFFLVSELTLPAGAATYINGPFVMLYAVVVGVTGCVFRFRLSLAAGVVAAIGYLACVALAAPELATIRHDDPRLQQDLLDPTIYAFKALMIVAMGALVGGIAELGKRLSLRVLVESQEKASLSRLFGEYVSEEVREKLLHDPPPEQGELAEVAILFSDIRGFTTLSETMAPEALVTRLNAYFDAMIEPIRAEGGVVDKFVGDAIMAVFGGVLALDAPADAAMRAACGMVRALEQLNARWAEAGIEPPFQAGIGLHFGPAILGSIGSASRKDFTVIGDAVNTASRVEGLSKDHPYPILLTRAVYERLPDELRAACHPLGAIPVKGRAAEVEVWGSSGRA